MTVKKIITFKCSDGKILENEAEALTYEQKLDIIRWMDNGNEIYLDRDGCKVDGDTMITWLDDKGLCLVPMDGRVPPWHAPKK